MKIMDREFIDNAIEKNKMVMLYFGNETCSICVDMKPKIKEILSRYEGIEFIDISIEDNIKLTRSFSIFTIPGILVYAEGKEVIREARFVSMDELEEKIKRYHEMLFN